MRRNVSILQNVGVVHAALFVLVLLLAQSVAGQVGATFYVSTSGNDSNPGTFAQPWKTIQHAATTVTAGATVNVMGGVYNEWVSFPNSGTAVAPITFQSYPVVVGTTVQPAVIDGTGLVTASGTKGLITISGARSYITVKGFELRNVVSASKISCGVYITGSGTGVQILNNLIHNVSATCGLFAYGTSQTPITGLVVSGNELYNLKTGSSESMTMNGNVTHFQITNNIVHDNNNIGIDIIGYERTGPAGYDEASYGVVSGNTVYNISGIGNSGEGAEYDADGLYCDGCAYTTFENNVIFQVDYGIETTSENTRCLITGTEWPGPDFIGTPATGTYPCYGRYATVRNNLFYYENAAGTSIGGYALAKAKGGGGNGGGSSFHDVFVNNTIFDNGTQPGDSNVGTPSGDFETQYQLGTQQADYFENNVVYESASSPYSVSPNMWINSYVPATQVYPPALTYTGAPATLNWNLYGSVAGYVEGTSILWADVSSFTSFSDYQTTTGEDANSINADPLFVNFGDTPPNVDTNTDSPAVGAGSTSLSCSVGWCDPNGSSPSSIYGSTDFLGNPRMNGSSIDIGAYQNTGNGISNSMTVNLTSGASTLQYGQSTTLTVTVTAIPGVGGAPSGTVSIMSGATLLETAALLPTGANSTAASMPLSASQLASGDNTLTAVYSGNSIAPCCNPANPPGGTQTPVPWYPGATSAPITVTETQATTSIDVTSVSPAAEDYGYDAPVTITAVLSWTANGVAPTAGAVTIGGSGPSGTYVTTGCSAPSGTTMTCTGTYTPTVADGYGPYTETATFAGDANYSGSSSPQANNFTINQATSTTAVTSTPNPSTYAQSVTFTATISGENGLVKGRKGASKKPLDVTGTVTWSANTGCSASTVSGYPGIATCTTSSLAVGTDAITATYSGDSNHSGSTGTLSQVVQGGVATTINVTSVSPAAEDFGLDAPVTITAALSWTGGGAAPTASAVTIGGNGPSGYGTTSCAARVGNTITCTNTYTPTATDVAGFYTETASFAGDTNYAGSSSPQTNNFTINQASSSTSVGCTPYPSTYGQSVTCTATINGENNLVKGRRQGKPLDITGSVTWNIASCNPSAVTQSNPGTATCITSSLAGGSDTVTATYNGDSNHGTSTGSFVQQVNQASQTIGVSVPAPATATNRSSFTVTASATSGLPITFSSAGACFNKGATYTIDNTTGTCTVTMSQAGNSNYTAAPTVTETTTVAAAIAPTVSVTVPATAYYQSTYAVVATTNASTTPTITAAPATVCTISGTTVTMMNGTGTCTVTAKWAADDVYKAATAKATTTAEKVASVVTWATPAPITYGTALSATQLDATASVAGKFVYTPASGKVLAAGTHTLSVTFTPTEATHYTTVTGTTVALLVNPANTTTSITSTTPNPSKVGKLVTVKFTVVPGKPTGSVTVSASSGETCSGKLTAGRGYCKLGFGTSGSITLTATYGGNVNNNSSVSAGFTQTVN